MPDEFIFGTRDEALSVAERKQWRPTGRASWVKPDGTFVILVRFPEQLMAIQKGERVHVIGSLDAKCARLLRRKGAVVVWT